MASRPSRYRWSGRLPQLTTQPGGGLSSACLLTQPRAGVNLPVPRLFPPERVRWLPLPGRSARQFLCWRFVDPPQPCQARRWRWRGQAQRLPFGRQRLLPGFEQRSDCPSPPLHCQRIRCWPRCGRRVLLGQAALLDSLAALAESKHSKDKRCRSSENRSNQQAPQTGSIPGFLLSPAAFKLEPFELSCCWIFSFASFSAS